MDTKIVISFQDKETGRMVKSPYKEFPAVERLAVAVDALERAEGPNEVRATLGWLNDRFAQ